MALAGHPSIHQEGKKIVPDNGCQWRWRDQFARIFQIGPASCQIDHAIFLSSNVGVSLSSHWQNSYTSTLHRVARGHQN